MNISEALKLLTRFPRNPFGVLDELKVRWELLRERRTILPPSYQPENFQDVITEVEKCLQMDLQVFLAEPELAEIEEIINRGIQKLSNSKAPFPIIHNGDFTLGRLCYIICRAIQPAVFVETGVAYGVTSSFILKAFNVNKRGKLFSVDNPPIARNAAAFVGALIPGELRGNWQLHCGESQKLLPPLLSKLKQVDIFLHDSRHTYSNMSAEFQIAAPYLTSRSFLIADDVNRNIAFQEWVIKTKPAFWATVLEENKESLFGISIFREKPELPQMIISQK